MHLESIDNCISDADWQQLFTDILGWDSLRSNVDISLAERGQKSRGWDAREERLLGRTYRYYTFSLAGVAQKRGVAIYVCSPYKDNQLPDYQMRRNIHERLTKRVREHIIIFTGNGGDIQLWQWMATDDSGRKRYYEHSYTRGDSNAEFLQRIAKLQFALVEEDHITVTAVLSRVRDAMYVWKRTIELWRVRLHDYEAADVSEALSELIRRAYTQRGVSRSEERYLIDRAQSGNESARNRLLETFLYIPLEMAYKVKRKVYQPGVELVDIVSEGYFGLIRAIDLFRPEFNQRFQTYAALWVRNRILRAIPEHRRHIRLPQYVEASDEGIRIDRDLVTDILMQRNFATPTGAEVTEALSYLGWKHKHVEAVSTEVLSLDSDDLGTMFGEWVDYVECSDIQRIIAIRKCLEHAIATLPPQHKRVIEMRFGLRGLDRHTLQEAGDELGLTRERIRQIEKAALTKLSKSSKKLGLTEYCTMPNSDNDLSRAVNIGICR